MRVLVTGGAGFIGSHLVEAFVARGDDVVVLDDLSTGFDANVHPSARLVVGSVADERAVRDAMEGCQLVLHEAAHKAVLRSVEQPLATDTANTHGTLTILKVAHEVGVERVVHASSSSVYGAVTKLAAEHYCRVYSELHGLETVALRYFNVYGPRQRPDAAYAAVIPLFVDALLRGRELEVHGDGRQSRDFTYVSDVVSANLAASTAPAAACCGKSYNIALGDSTSLLDLLRILGELLGVASQPRFTEPRPGDVRSSLADPSAAARDLDFRCRVGIQEGLARTVDWLRTRRD